MGRPSKFDESKCLQAEKLCKLGATDKELADFFEVSEQTLNTWKKDHPEFLESLKKGKGLADAEVGERLFQRACGFSHPDVHISNYQGAITQTPIVKQHAPDTTACIFWLKNRRPDLWRDRMEHTGRDGGPIETKEVSDDELSRWMAFEATKKVLKKVAQDA
jgi:hypothetical protein